MTPDPLIVCIEGFMDVIKHPIGFRWIMTLIFFDKQKGNGVLNFLVKAAKKSRNEFEGYFIIGNHLRQEIG